MKPTAEEIEAYYLGGGSLSAEVYAATEQYVKERYLDGGTRAQFVSRRKIVEAKIAETLDQS